MKIASPPRRGRPRSFDEQQVLRAVTDVFWNKGYAAASLDELAGAAGINRPSLYAALGDKQAMYLKALESVEAALEEQLARALDPDRSLEEGLLDFYRASIDVYLSGEAGPRGCLLLSAAVADAVENPAVKLRLRGVLDRMDDAFARRIADATGRGREEPEVITRAKLASAALHSLAVRARAGQERGLLEQFATSAARSIGGMPSRS